MRVNALLELAALQAVHGADKVILTDDSQQQLLDLAASGTLEEATAAALLASNHISATIRLHALLDQQKEVLFHGSSNFTGQALHQKQPQHLDLELRVSLPPAYSSPPQPSPGSPASEMASDSRAVASQCNLIVNWMRAVGNGREHVGREWMDTLTAELGRLSEEAAREGRPCLHELCEHAQAALDQLALKVAAAGADATTDPGSGTGPGVAADVAASHRGLENTSRGHQSDEQQVLLLRLDHMHNRALYGRTIGSWIRELRLTGRLIFQGSLILVLLEGDSRALREYLVRHRTESVDVDSRGRKCQERMMDVIVQQPSRRQQQQQKQQKKITQHKGQLTAVETTTSCVSRGDGNASGSERAFPDYREVHLETLDQVRQLLQQAGLEEWLRPAAGLR
ncbi:hypothetical protein VaNZ11_001949 [Volvox africanus]|uniref:RWD domain-containing protein 3 n=1 Tax=Volvox africanus TaxID=51714 RepID=A0ABQ5RQR0_9CHLO|nr:hypothetical protein VaNZ11_001949 [Volvox africanus]